MLLTDLNGPMSLQPRRTGLGRNSHAGRVGASAILFLSFATLGAAVSRAQDQQDPKPQQDQSVAEAARQERARKQEKQKTAKHIYTEEDLKRPNILTPEDRAEIEAKRNECAQKNNCSPAASQNPPASLDANSPASGTSVGSETSLGEVARQLRKQRELEALKPKQTEPFHLPIQSPTFASPILPGLLPIQPLAQPARPKISSPELLSPRIPSRKISSAKPPANIFRRDPFSGMPAPLELRRPEVVRPEIARPKMNGDVHPKLRAKVAPRDGAAADLKMSSSARPKVGNDLLPTVPPTRVLPDFSEVIRPTLRAHNRLTSPAQPKISSRLATPKLFAQSLELPAPLAPAQPAAPVAESVQPSVPVSTIRPAVTSAVAAPAQPVAPPVTVSPVQPKRIVPAAPVTTQHTVSVQRGDSLWKLAQQNLGSGNRWPELAAVNPGIVNPNQIRTGAQLNLPTTAASVRRSAKSSAANTIEIHKGDTLWSLAKSNLGRSAAWPCLAAANPSLSDANRIFAGQLLVVPAGCGAAATMDSHSHAN
jgi:nucleoid-associated protein YgaU